MLFVMIVNEFLRKCSCKSMINTCGRLSMKNLCRYMRFLASHKGFGTHWLIFLSVEPHSCAEGNRTLSFRRRKSKSLVDSSGMSSWHTLAVRLLTKVNPFFTVLNLIILTFYDIIKHLNAFIL